jgi:hypothetical protein
VGQSLLLLALGGLAAWGALFNRREASLNGGTPADMASRSRSRWLWPVYAIGAVVMSIAGLLMLVLALA